eukprot:Blabericola_migrator_1__1705@NODE_145_length_12990_cov_99_814439_g126_i0_p3_GENE_NODE_145_length_12990_cov_99_814439_g126_i0NODE_145_length_12990_cov_99_814439_g126_i0_p3_ORF_typecomplete_len660_score88_23TMEM43/PF07787_12/2_3e25Sugar_tr/PF00083_24/0_12DUF998/PF06197_13/1_2e02DUF998/PF06197_13/1_NODE_145_length_12990_cov_99_814439_g126_i056567635
MTSSIKSQDDFENTSFMLQPDTLGSSSSAEKSGGKENNPAKPSEPTTADKASQTEFIVRSAQDEYPVLHDFPKPESPQAKSTFVPVQKLKPISPAGKSPSHLATPKAISILPRPRQTKTDNTRVAFDYPAKSSPYVVPLVDTSPDKRRSTPKFEEFTQAWDAYKKTLSPELCDFHLKEPELPSPVRSTPENSPLLTLVVPDATVSPLKARVTSPIQSPNRTLDKTPLILESADKMAPPVAPRTVSCVGYVFAVAIFLCGMAAMLTADFSSGLVQHAILPLRRAVKPVSCEPLSENDNKIVHIDCPIRKLQTFNPPSDFSVNLAPFKGIFFEMRVEMFQYNIVPGLLRSSLGGVWSDSLLPSHEGWTWFSSAKNPDFFPHVPGSGRHFSNSLYGGGFRLERPHLIDFHTKRQLPLKDDGLFTEDPEKPPTRVSSRNTQLYKDYLYTGDPLRPAVGDIRISFYGSAATHVSAVGYQTGILGGSWTTGDRALKGFVNPLSKNNETRTLVMEGDYTAKDLMDAFTQENDVPSRYLAVTRSIGGLCAFTFFWFTFKMFRREPTPCMSSIFCAVGLCFAAVGVTKLTYSIPAAIASTVTGLILLSIGLGTISCDANPAEKRPSPHDYIALTTTPAPETRAVSTPGEPRDPSPAAQSHSNSVYAPI